MLKLIFGEKMSRSLELCPKSVPQRKLNIPVADESFPERAQKRLISPL
jgi:hypothetical protein